MNLSVLDLVRSIDIVKDLAWHKCIFKDSLKKDILPWFAVNIAVVSSPIFPVESIRELPWGRKDNVYLEAPFHSVDIWYVICSSIARHLLSTPCRTRHNIQSGQGMPGCVPLKASTSVEKACSRYWTSWKMACNLLATASFSNLLALGFISEENKFKLVFHVDTISPDKRYWRGRQFCHSIMSFFEVRRWVYRVHSTLVIHAIMRMRKWDEPGKQAEL